MNNQEEHNYSPTSVWDEIIEQHYRENQEFIIPVKVSQHLDRKQIYDYSSVILHNQKAQLEIFRLKAELLRTQKRLEQSNLDIMDNLDQINRARHQVELKQADITRLEKKIEEQALTIADYMESNFRLEKDKMRPCGCLVKTEIACESFRQSTNQTLIRWVMTAFIVLVLLSFYFYI